MSGPHGGPHFERVAIVGLGLLGGSVGLAARARGVAREVRGASRSRESLERALACGAVDRGCSELGAAVDAADLVVLATPPAVMPALVRRMTSQLAPGCVVTDVGSVKGVLTEVIPGLLPPGVNFVGAHPMAGSHEKGVAHARADLFEEAVCVVTPIPGNPPAAIEAVEGFWSALGARVVRRDPEGHDREVAWVSHLPHALAFAFAHALAAAPESAGELAGSGFRDFTRIAAADPELWAEILGANRKALAGPLQESARRLADLAGHLEAGDADALERFIAEAGAALSTVRAGGTGERSSGDPSPEIQAARQGGPERSSKT